MVVQPLRTRLGMRRTLITWKNVCYSSFWNIFEKLVVL
jgi:hypothetical protein